MQNYDLGKRCILFYEKFEKNEISIIALFHIGALCSKTLNGLSYVKKCIKLFHFFVFYNVFDQNNGKKLLLTQKKLFGRTVLWYGPPYYSRQNSKKQHLSIQNFLDLPKPFAINIPASTEMRESKTRIPTKTRPLRIRHMVTECVVLAQRL